MRLTKKAALLIGTTALAVGLVAVPAWAYFTDQSSANGALPVALDPTPGITETIDDNLDKHVVIENTGDADALVRVQVFAADELEAQYTGTDWQYNEEDGFWYYTKILGAGESSSELFIDVTIPEDSAQDFDIIVIQQSTEPVWSDGYCGVIDGDLVAWPVADNE